jgi:hypothetical protein
LEVLRKLLYCIELYYIYIYELNNI